VTPELDGHASFAERESRRRGVQGRERRAMTLSRSDHHTCRASRNLQSVCLRNRPESSQALSSRDLPDRAPGTVTFQRERLQYPGTQGRSDKMGPSGRGTPSFRTLLSLASQTRTSQRSCIVVRERQSSPGDRIGTSMRTSDGPSRHQVSGKILRPRSDRDRRACPELQGFVLQHVRDCEAGT
jgi:hypothetical protein